MSIKKIYNYTLRNFPDEHRSWPRLTAVVLWPRKKRLAAPDADGIWQVPMSVVKFRSRNYRRIYIKFSVARSAVKIGRPITASTVRIWKVNVFSLLNQRPYHGDVLGVETGPRKNVGPTQITAFTLSTHPLFSRWTRRWVGPQLHNGYCRVKSLALSQKRTKIPLCRMDYHWYVNNKYHCYVNNKYHCYVN